MFSILNYPHEPINPKGIGFEKQYKTSKVLQKVIVKIRSKVEFLDKDRYLKDDIDKINSLIKSDKNFVTDLNGVFNII